jgi:hypothetical protein
VCNCVQNIVISQMDTIQHTKLECVDNQNIRGSTEDGLENNMNAKRQKVIDLG